MVKQKNIEVIAINLPAGEEELLGAAAQYFADRMLTPKQQKAITLLIDAANRPIRVPLSRDMLSERPGVFGASLPSIFEMSVSTAAGIKDALEVVAHEIVHVSQVLNRRLRMRPSRVKSYQTDQMSYSVNWLGDKFPSLDELPWHLRPWEIEACQWQVILVGEFIERMTGSNSQIVIQSGRNNQLALLNVRPSAIKAPPQSPSLSAVTAVAEISLTILESNQSLLPSGEKHVPTSVDNDDSMSGGGVQETGNKLDFEQSSTRKNSTGMMPEKPADDAEDISDFTHQVADDKEMQSSRTIYNMVSGMMNGHQNSNQNSNQNGHQNRRQNDFQNGDASKSQNGATCEASNDGENTAIQIRIDGLDAPRLLSRGALSSKLDDLLARGLIAPEDAKAAQTSLTSADD
jgi:hypothetical protein